MAINCNGKVITKKISKNNNPNINKNPIIFPIADNKSIFFYFID